MTLTTVLFFGLILVLKCASRADEIANELPNDQGIIDEKSPETKTSNEGISAEVVEDVEGSSSETNSDYVNDSNSTLRVKCEVRNESSSTEIMQVRLVNSSEMTELLDGVVASNSSEKNECLVVMFYLPSCIFSCKAAPSFNALARVFPQIQVLAFDAYANNGINMRFGLVGVPSILILHNSKLVAKFNDSDPSIEGLAAFVTKITGLNPVGDVVVTEEDRKGPVPTNPEPRIDSVLIISWIFVLTCFCYFFSKSSTCRRFIEFVRNNWREAEAQHLHAE